MEDLASTPIDQNSGAATALPSNASASSLVSTTTIQNPPPPAPEPLPASVEDFDELIVKEVAKYVEKSAEIGDLVEEQVRHPPSVVVYPAAPDSRRHAEQSCREVLRGSEKVSRHYNQGQEARIINATICRPRC